ncbi:acetyl-CoA carboxylase biotin carboxyl carrier protein subunit [bacterium]|jgi:biotin carboxyl carrier protein|nr:acetyl-CoA carboxylase biotin carboxyl carrier protein subunit [Bacteroidota bacterium]MDA7625669.1 acetyl-CoA carboxylase biotin carboxyl carrier protein subunit [bacterium]MDF1864610.1 acetyl-CoA carboxylase biotin carboxyl carrier protein subunit [Saprospiraceae bacterium]
MINQSSFLVDVNEEKFEFKLDELLDFDFIELKDAQFHILDNNQAFLGSIESYDPTSKSMIVLLNGNKYPIQIKDHFDQLVEKMGLSTNITFQIKEIKAPMPGLVLDLEVEPGQTVSQGDVLLILEAMKMENVLKSPGDGIVKSIAVKKGDAVEKGQILIEME